MGNFKASVQYGDWEGSAAADRADMQDLASHLRERGLLGDDEFLVGIELWVGENHDGELAEPAVTALIYPAAGYDNVAAELRGIDGEISVRKVDLEMSLRDFLLRFKRFAVTLTPRGLDLTGRDYREIER